MYVVGKDSAVVRARRGDRQGDLDASRPKARPTNRGFNYWESKDRSDRRIIFASRSYLQQLDARTGKPITTFGVNGLVNLREGLGRAPVPTGGAQSGSPGHVFENLLVLGSAPGEGYNSPPGDIRAFDVLTGRLVWTFHTIPRPGEFGYDTWPPDAWKTAGGANTWAEFAIDEKRGIGYFPLGSPTFDLWGGDRKGNNLFGNTLLALDLRTGKRLWHYQLLHHDLWDYDLVTGPKLLTVTHNGKPVDIVAQATKFGLLYVFNRVTGAAALADRGAAGAAERRARRAVVADAAVSDQAGAVFAAEVHRGRRQPVPRRGGARSASSAFCKDARNEGIFTPLSITKDQISVPGELGGANWGGAAADPETGMLYVRSADQPALHTPLKPVEKSDGDRHDDAAAALHGTARDDVLRGEWDERDEPALGAAHRLRSEYRRHQVEGAARRRAVARGERHYEHGQQLSRASQRSGGHRRRIDLHRALRRSHHSRVRQRQRQDSVGKEDDAKLRRHPVGVRGERPTVRGLLRQQRRPARAKATSHGKAGKTGRRGITCLRYRRK